MALLDGSLSYIEREKSNQQSAVLIFDMTCLKGTIRRGWASHSTNDVGLSWEVNPADVTTSQETAHVSFLTGLIGKGRGRRLDETRPKTHLSLGSHLQLLI